MKVFLLVMIAPGGSVDTQAFRGPLSAGDAVGKLLGACVCDRSLDAAFMWNGDDDIALLNNEGKLQGLLLAREVQ